MTTAASARPHTVARPATHQPAAAVLAPELAYIKAALSSALVLRWAGSEVNERGRGDLFGHQYPREYHRQSPRAFTMNREPGSGRATRARRATASRSVGTCSG